MSGFRVMNINDAGTFGSLSQNCVAAFKMCRTVLNRMSFEFPHSFIYIL